ncbi:MAG TPA: hypothetical protein VMT16_06505 [Thermoanaerobaculia bacterium]|nr:hypothetical protein [Thermoanaerobaculia bacterium]
MSRRPHDLLAAVAAETGASWLWAAAHVAALADPANRLFPPEVYGHLAAGGAAAGDAQR